jgi:hypothetical protein
MLPQSAESLSNEIEFTRRKIDMVKAAHDVQGMDRDLRPLNHRLAELIDEQEQRAEAKAKSAD